MTEKEEIDLMFKDIPGQYYGFSDGREEAFDREDYESLEPILEDDYSEESDAEVHGEDRWT